MNPRKTLQMKADYHINIFFSVEDGGYIADIPDLQCCSAFGETPQQALAEVEKAKLAWLAAAKAGGKPIPQPRYRPFIYSSECAHAGKELAVHDGGDGYAAAKPKRKQKKS